MTNLHHFTPSEFTRAGIEWFELCHPSLLVRADVLRQIWGQPIDISPHPKAIGRYDGGSWHNVEKHGQVMALDLMPRGVENYHEAAMLVDVAKQVGFTGIGFYPHWHAFGKQRPGIHVDIRTDRTPDSPALWGGILGKKGQEYVSLDKALKEMR